MIDPEELGRRLREARERAGLTQEEVARALGISRTAVTQLEAGRRKVSGLELARLAFLYGRTADSFFEPSPEGRGVSVLLRAAHVAEAAEETREAIRRGVALAREIFRLEDILGVERVVSRCPQYPASLPSRRWEAVEQGNLLAHRERQRLELGAAPAAALGELLEAQGLVILGLELPDNLSGFTVRLEAEQGIACGVNIRHSPERLRFSLAHEYCHVLVDHDLPGIVSGPEETDKPREVRANAFAAAFLMPEDGIRDALGRLRKGLPSRLREAVVSPEDRVRLVEGRLPPHAGDIGIWHVCLLASHFGVSRKALIWRLFNLGLVSESDRDRLLAAEEDGWARRLARLLEAEAAGEPAAPPGLLARRRMLHLALEALRRELISRRKCLELIELAGVPAEEARQLVEGVGVETVDV